MLDTYDSHEQAALFALMLARRKVPNTVLVSEYGIKLSPAGRARLDKKGLLRFDKVSGRLFYQITDEGIAWCTRELANVETPARSGPLAKLVFELMRHLPHYLQLCGVDLTEVLNRGGVEDMIREVYRDLSVKRQDWVRLADIRPAVEGVGRENVDGVLLKMIKTGLVHLAPDSNRKTLTDTDHDAAVRIGGEENHLLAIEES